MFYSNCDLWTQYSKNPHKRAGVLGVQADFVLINGFFLQIQPENVLKVFLKSFL